MSTARPTAARSKALLLRACKGAHIANITAVVQGNTFTNARSGKNIAGLNQPLLMQRARYKPAEGALPSTATVTAAASKNLARNASSPSSRRTGMLGG